MTDFKELEYKYKADNVSLRDFQNLMELLKPSKHLAVSSWDHYMTKEGSDDFVRFRHSDAPELTKKVKTKQTNNWDRVEVDLPLDPTRVTLSVVKKFLELEGYTKETKLYKNCFIYWTTYVNYVYYIVYNENMKELGRYLEVEVNKDKVEFLNHVEINGPHIISMDPPKFTGGSEIELNKAEKVLEAIGISPQNRMKKSLFELYVKE